jgi:uncharacterized protein (TIGR02145 family)
MSVKTKKAVRMAGAVMAAVVLGMGTVGCWVWDNSCGGNNIVYGALIDSRDGKIYRTVTIGSQTWMAENLNYDTTGSVCYNNKESNCERYGRLYNWNTVMAGSSTSSSNPSGIQGICPSGWHVPSDAEWTALMNIVGSSAGTKLKSTSGWSSGGNGMDDCGFSALPGGGCGSSFFFAGSHGFWWSATERGASSAWYRDMYYLSDDVYRVNNYKTYLFALRCVSDEVGERLESLQK